MADKACELVTKDGHAGEKSDVVCAVERVQQQGGSLNVATEDAAVAFAALCVPSGASTCQNAVGQ